MKTRIATLAAAALAAGTCLGGATPGSAADLVFWHHTYPPATEFINKKIEEFRKDNPDINIKVEDVPHGEYEVRLLAALASGSPPDIVNVLDYLYPSYVGKKLLAPVDLKSFGVASQAELEALYQPQALSGLTIDGTTYGVPEEFNTLALFLNKEHFTAVGLNADDPATWPKTWGDLFTLADKLQTKEGDQVTRLGFNWVWGLDPYWYAQQYWPILQQYGCNVADETGKVTIDAPECVAAFTDTWQRLVSDGLGGPALATVNPVNALEDFSSGRQSMAIAGIWAPPLYSPAVQASYVVAPLPQKDPANPHTLLNSYSLAVPAASPNQAAAWKFLSFLTADSDGYLKSTGYVTGRKGWGETPVAKETRGAAIFYEGQKHGSFVWRSPTWTEEGNAIKVAIEQFAQGTPVKDALSEAAREIESIRSR